MGIQLLKEQPPSGVDSKWSQNLLLRIESKSRKRNGEGGHLCARLAQINISTLHDLDRALVREVDHCLTILVIDIRAEPIPPKWMNLGAKNLLVTKDPSLKSVGVTLAAVLGRDRPLFADIVLERTSPGRMTSFWKLLLIATTGLYAHSIDRIFCALTHRWYPYMPIYYSYDRRMRLPSDYRPSSPEWVSRAGGVAIMRKKTPSLPSWKDPIRSRIFEYKYL
jgi:hypothetical protein